MVKKSKLVGFTRILMGLIVLITLSYFIQKNQELLMDYAGYGYLGIFISCFIANSTVFLPAPSITIVFTFSSIYPPLIVASVGALGAAFGEVVGYGLGYSGHMVIDDKRYERIRQWSKRYGFWAIFLFAFVPLPLFDLVGVSSGMLRISFFGFFLPTFFGKWIKMMLYAYLGAGLLPFLSPFLISVLRS